MVKLLLSSKEVLEKKFSFVSDGYNPYDVDEFLDNIIRDYLKVEENVLEKKEDIEILTKRIDELNKENDALKSELSKYQKRFEGIKENNNVTNENIDYLQRISKLETALWKAGIDPNKI